MSNTILVTGGAGFIGQHLCRRLLVQGYNVRILDNFSDQVHSTSVLPEDLAKNVEIFRGDIRDRAILSQAISGSDKLVHLAAETGTGQSMYEIEHYFSVNVQGTALLLDVLANDKVADSISSLVVASSRSIYGEGQYRCAIHGAVSPRQRDVLDMKKGCFDVSCPDCGGSVDLEKTSEKVPLKPLSYYGLTKQIQEQAVLMHASNRDISGYGLRYQNVYGPGQSLKNPYTGILAIFSNLARQNSDIQVYEDGLESRDFVYIDDVIDATFRSIDHQETYVGAMNVGSGVATSVIDVASAIKSYFNSDSIITIGGEFRIGDIRHNIADISLISGLLGYTPNTVFLDGLNKFLSWAESEPVSDKLAYIESVDELSKRGLMG
ncbi:SDR family NAD(P)-dependent oxidoreductase [Gammaproteobacteria bacterium]|nr:SDR family NAD(P)-dependent oxidoreductase [Gammaproteobacteria bacterium]